MGRMKDANWPAEPAAPRPPAPIKHAIRAAWREFWRDLKEQRRKAKFFKEPHVF